MFFVCFLLQDLLVFYSLGPFCYKLYNIWIIPKERVRKMGFLYIFIFKELSTADETLRATKLE